MRISQSIHLFNRKFSSAQTTNTLNGKKRKNEEMKLKGRIAIYLFGLFLILPAGDSPLWGEEDHLAQYGVIKFDQKLDAPEFSLSDLAGKKRSLSEFKGKFIMMNFWATW